MNSINTTNIKNKLNKKKKKLFIILDNHEQLCNYNIVNILHKLPSYTNAIVEIKARTVSKL